MGIDPVTHEPLSKQETPNNEEEPQSCLNDHLQDSDNNHSQLPETDGGTKSEYSSSSSSSMAENCLIDHESQLLESISNDDSLLNCLWGDEPSLVDASPWKFPTASHDESLMTNNINNGVPSWEDDNCAWLLDCQDFGVHDYGFECFNDVDQFMNSLNTLEMVGDDHKQ